MIAIKKINNNVAVCLDSSKKELVAFGRGIGFPAMPYEIEDLGKIDQTFYNVNNQYIALINDISPQIIEFTSNILDQYKKDLKYELNPNTVFTLADHLSFAIQREKRGIYVKLPYSYDLEQMYPVEIAIAAKIREKLNQKFGVHLLKSEISGIAMNLINNRYNEQKQEQERESHTIQFEEILEESTKIVEETLAGKVKRDSFSYARFATHLQYLVERLQSAGQLNSDNQLFYRKIYEQCPLIAKSVDRISAYLCSVLECELSEEEKLYLILHVNRVCEKEGL